MIIQIRSSNQIDQSLRFKLIIITQLVYKFFQHSCQYLPPDLSATMYIHDRLVNLFFKKLDRKWTIPKYLEKLLSIRKSVKLYQRPFGKSNRIESEGLSVSGTGCDNLRFPAESRTSQRYSSGRVPGVTGTMPVTGIIMDLMTTQLSG